MTRQKSSLLANDFFYLQGYAHRDLFDQSAPVWMALETLKTYLESFKFPKMSFDASYYIKSPEKVYIGKETKIDPYVTIEGPCIIGEGCIIRSGANIRSGCVIGDRCVIGHNVEINRSILLNDAKIPHLNYVGDSIVGNKVNLGAGSICANVRLDKGSISISHDGQKIETPFTKLGAILGDDAQIACRVVLNPGTLVFPNAKVFGKR